MRTTSSLPALCRENDFLRIRFGNGCEVSLDCRARRMNGIRHVTFRGRPLRSPQEAVWPEIATPDGREVDHYELLDARLEGDAVVVITRPWWRTAHRMEWQEHGGHQRVATTSWSNGAWHEEPHRMVWRLRAERDFLGGREYNGFSYAYAWNAPGYAVFHVEDKASWELGGCAAGNTWIMRNTFAASVRTLDHSGFDSGWTLPGIANPWIFQHMPLVSCLGGFTFQHDTDLALVTVPERPSHVRSLFHQDAGSNLLLHFNQFVFDLAEHFELPAHRILAAAVDADETDRRNHYLAVRDTIQDRIRAHYGDCRQRARPGGTIEDWGLQNLANLPPALEWMHAQGLRQIFIQPLWRSNETDVVPALRGADPQCDKRWGTLGNMCCILEPEIAARYGGWPALEAAMEPARRLGLECSTWYSHCFSSLSPLAGEPGFFARDQSGQLSRSNYGHVLFANNNSSPAHLAVFQATMRKLRDCGFRGIFRDSHFNMGTDTVDWRPGGDPPWDRGLTPDQVFRQVEGKDLPPPRIRSMHDAVTEQMRFCQQELGFTYFVETPGLPGLPQCGTAYRRLHGNEWLFDDLRTPYESDDMAKLGIAPVDAYFRGMANRLFLAPLVNPRLWPAPEAHQKWYDPVGMAPLNHGFLRVEALLDRRRILPDGQGVAWAAADGCEVVFAFRDFDHPLADRIEAVEVVAGDACDAAGGRLRCLKNRIYRVRPAG